MIPARIVALCESARFWKFGADPIGEWAIASLWAFWARAIGPEGGAR